MTGTARLRPWLPAAALVAALLAGLFTSGTPVMDVLRYAGYLGYAVLAPGMLVFRALRRTPHTVLEDVVIGFAVGLALELAAFTVWSAAGWRDWLWLWPLLVFAAFLAVPGLRRHWWVRGYGGVPVRFAWALSGIGISFVGYLWLVYLHPTAILPRGPDQQVYLDLPFELSLAGEAKHHFPLHVPQVAQEPLHYHWFAFAHMGTASLVSRVDLPVILYRLDIPVLCLAAIAGLAVAGWRVTGRPAVGLAATVLTFVVGELNFTNPVTMPFGGIATFIVWSSPSLTYSWVLLTALIGVLVELIRRPRAGPQASAVPPIGRGVWVLLALLGFASTGAKATAIPVTLGAVTAVAALRLIQRVRLDRRLVDRVRLDRRLLGALDRRLLGALGILLAAEVFAQVVIFAGETHGSRVYPFWGMIRYYPAGGGVLAVVGIAVAFAANLLLRQAGIPVLLWRRRRLLGDVEAYLVGGLLAGLGAYLVIGHPGDSNQYFIRDGWLFGVIASGWAWLQLADRLPRQWQVRLGAAAGGYAVLLVAAQLLFARPGRTGGPFSPLWPIVGWLTVLIGLGAVVALAWRVVARARRVAGATSPPMGTAGLAVLTAVLLAGAPGLVMDAVAAASQPNGGAYKPVPLPDWRVDAARWLRGHSDPDDVLVTNAHCLQHSETGRCDARMFWLSAYAERRVLIEGWLFAPRATSLGAFGANELQQFWDPQLLQRNDAAINDPTPALLADLHDRYGVRWLVVDRTAAPENAHLFGLADKQYDNGRVAIYRLR